MSYSEIEGTRTEREILEDEVKSLQLALQNSRSFVAEDEDTSEDDDDDSSQGKNRKYNLSSVCPGQCFDIVIRLIFIEEFYIIYLYFSSWNQVRNLRAE